MIVLRNICVSYDAESVLKGVNMNIEPGKVNALLGPNGSGKTTTIKLILGTLKPISGKVLVGNMDPSIDPVKVKKMIGYVPEDDLIVSKTIGSTILYLPIPLIVFILSSTTLSPIHGLIAFTSMILYWVLASFYTYSTILSLLWGRHVVWTEFSLGVLKRIGIIITNLLPLAIYIPIILLLYIYMPLTALTIYLATPTPIFTYMLLKALRGR